MCHKRVKIKKLVKSSNKDEVNKMTPSDQQQLKVHLKAAAEILYRNTDPTELKSFESIEIEKSVRQKMLEEVGPELGSFFFQQYQEFKQENPEK
jgi:UDP-3-O-acyl-N-acetylglucosamine deacetylase